MNSKIDLFLNRMVSFILGTFFFLIGTFCLALPWSESLKGEAIHLILNEQIVIALFGLGFTLIGLSILVYNVLTTRKRTIYIRRGKNAITVDKEIIHQYLDKYWQQQFPNFQILSIITIKKDAIYITVDLPPLLSHEEEAFKERVERELNDIFGRLLGYPQEVFFIASFKPKITPVPASRQ